MLEMKTMVENVGLGSCCSGTVRELSLAAFQCVSVYLFLDLLLFTITSSSCGRLFYRVQRLSVLCVSTCPARACRHACRVQGDALAYAVHGTPDTARRQHAFHAPCLGIVRGCPERCSVRVPAC